MKRMPLHRLKDDDNRQEYSAEKSTIQLRSRSQFILGCRHVLKDDVLKFVLKQEAFVTHLEYILRAEPQTARAAVIVHQFQICIS
uniref:Uncharacterized protein n=1 Tax=Arundo donax TaxID=35708 RepID=A0A0A9G9A6_ARUDO